MVTVAEFLVHCTQATPASIFLFLFKKPQIYDVQELLHVDVPLDDANTTSFLATRGAWPRLPPKGLDLGLAKPYLEIPWNTESIQQGQGNAIMYT